ncbi:hypothetical protein VFPFJ_10846 [Purpureocillium lilacinum]|uniref:Uncharacterized protein n=1 Tax=Purpureocillium lilacinum TaxID=33203 RepID=A0A179GBV5_PURLI|nr:hypothetical protein VFPFJ_10846 [Purpureocillium lilacinum]OAQ75008.1 hypothetical protein VFPFJ_10846 [Purpureocillium lilacinum]
MCEAACWLRRMNPERLPFWEQAPPRECRLTGPDRIPCSSAVYGTSYTRLCWQRLCPRLVISPQFGHAHITVPPRHASYCTVHLLSWPCTVRQDASPDGISANIIIGSFEAKTG